MKNLKNSPGKSSRASVTAPRLQAEWFDEPVLQFADAHTHSDPKVGINLFGPRSFNTIRHRAEVHFGFIGSGESIETSARFYEKCSQGVNGDMEHEPFPGCDKDTGFRTALKIDTGAAEIITTSELHQLGAIRTRKQRFETAVTLLDEKFRLLKLKERPIDYVVFAIPPDLYDLCRVVDYTDSTGQGVHRDLRRAF